MSTELARTNTIDVYKSPTAAMLSICGKAMTLLEGKMISRDNIIVVLRTIMEAIDTMSIVEKIDKKLIALDCLHWLVGQQNMKDDERNFMSQFIDLTAPAAIEVIVAATKGLTEINLAKKWLCCM
jgi:hypothetical protein